MGKFLQAFFVLSLAISISNIATAQTTISGIIEDPEYNEPLIGASIVLEGTSIGTVSNTNGNFELVISESGEVNIVISYVGYDEKKITIQADGTSKSLGNIELKQNTIGVLEIYVIADRAKERETPVAFSTIRRKDIDDQLGSRDIPMILNVTPSVYATQSGGGAGDARINVRGFDQRNVAIMINGVPVNDMENGWVYWSNWDGIADATSSIQLQRGLSAVNLATPSIGGTMNILTSPAEHDAGGDVKFEIGSGNFFKTSVTGHSGLINDRFAISASLIRKVGNGTIDKTWTDAWAYYFGASFKLHKDHRLELFAMGAPQRHGQNLYMQNVAAYSHDYAKEIGADQGTLDEFPESNRGRLYNQTWNSVDPTYDGKQSFKGKEKDRYDKGFINERENYFHKPLVNLNWYARWTDKINMYTTAYYSGGKGGGTGTYGNVRFDYASQPTRIPDWNATINENINNNIWDYDNEQTGETLTQTLAPNQSVGAIRNSANEQWTVGAISRVKVRFNESLKASVGIDWRKAKIGHFREIRDLLGGDFLGTRDINGNRLIYEIDEDGNISYLFDESDFWSGENYNRNLGDKVAYHFTNTVDWIGYFAQLEYSREKITAYGTFGNSYIKYSYTNHFLRDGENPNSELKSESDYIAGYQIKVGLSYRPIDGISVFGNYGYISKAPIFDNVINDQNATVTKNPKNELFNAFEIGAAYNTPGKELDIKANYYYTSWKDRSNLERITNLDGSEGYVFLTGMDQLHKGVEVEITYKPIRILAIGAFASFAEWRYTKDVQGTYKDYDDLGQEEDVEYTYYVNNLKVGDAPQRQFGVNAAVFPIKNLRFQIDFRHNSRYYANWDPFSRTDEDDRTQVWLTPSHYIFDFHTSYKFVFKNDMSIEVFGHIFNLLDEIYIQDATDNSSYNGFYGTGNVGDPEFNHDVNTAEVYLGMPRTFNMGVRFQF